MFEIFYITYNCYFSFLHFKAPNQKNSSNDDLLNMDSLDLGLCHSMHLHIYLQRDMSMILADPECKFCTLSLDAAPITFSNILKIQKYSMFQHRCKQRSITEHRCKRHITHSNNLLFSHGEYNYWNDKVKGFLLQPTLQQQSQVASLPTKAHKTTEKIVPNQHMSHLLIP